MTSRLLVDYPELAHLSREDLEDLLNDPAYFQATFHSLSRVRELYRSQSELGHANEAIAQNNLALQQRLYDLRAETQAAFDDAKQLETRWKELEKEQKEVYQRFTPQFLLMRLKHSTTAQDEASETLASSFVSQQAYHQSSSGTTRNGEDVDEFVREYRELRKTYHKRAIWGEKWASGQVIWRED